MYYAILSNFETENPTWRFWRNFRKDRVADLAAGFVFPGDNDLVVDTWSMTDFGVPKLKLAGACDFGTSDTVWHCNYFRQDKSIKYIRGGVRLSARQRLVDGVLSKSAWSRRRTREAPWRPIEPPDGARGRVLFVRDHVFGVAVRANSFSSADVSYSLMAVRTARR